MGTSNPVSPPPPPPSAAGFSMGGEGEKEPCDPVEKSCSGPGARKPSLYLIKYDGLDCVYGLELNKAVMISLTMAKSDSNQTVPCLLPNTCDFPPCLRANLLLLRHEML
ncbi:Spindlin-1 [Tupaia chinensis]|uniref:Spindlin-1 n=1 Tax=Tupaia chinensis TaxID=246437 RepID=L9KVT6_TUPCH|nr:Spindlin-1 [Tupaia chinensis]